MPNILQRAASRARNLFAVKNATTVPNWFLDWVRGPEADSGVTVTLTTAMTLATVWQAINIIGGDVGHLPLYPYEKTDNGRERATNLPAYTLVRYRPNPWMNANTFWETVMFHTLWHGNGRAGIVRNGRSEAAQLVPFLPDRSRTEVKDGEKWHITRLGDEQKERAFPDRDVFHLPGLSYDGVTGMDVLSLMRNTVGLALAEQKHGSYTFRNAAKPAIILETENSFTPEAGRQMLNDWQRANAGIDNSGQTALLQRGVKAKILSASNNDAQWVESRDRTRQDIASIFNLPPHKLGDNQKAGYNGLEHEQLTYLNMTLDRWLNAIQLECREKLLTEDQKRSDRYYFEHNTAALLRSDLKTRYAAYAQGIAGEWLSPNDVRQSENMNKRPDKGGDEYRNPNTKVEQAPAGDKTGDSKPQPQLAKPKKNAVRRDPSIANMLGVERKRVNDAAAKSKNFIQWMDEFYDRWEPKLDDVAKACEYPEGWAKEHCAASKAMILTCCDVATAETLVADIDKLTSEWSGRATIAE